MKPAGRDAIVNLRKRAPVGIPGRSFGGSFARMGGSRIRTAIAAAAACLLVSSVSAREPRASGYQAYEFPDFTLITRDRAVALELPPQAAQTGALLAKLLARQTACRHEHAELHRLSSARYLGSILRRRRQQLLRPSCRTASPNYLLLSNREALEEPSNADLTIALAQLKRASGAPGDRLLVLTEALRYSKSLEQRRWLANQLKSAGSP
jgi:hypothetical protein